MPEGGCNPHKPRGGLQREGQGIQDERTDGSDLRIELTGEFSRLLGRGYEASVFAMSAKLALRVEQIPQQNGEIAAAAVVAARSMGLNVPTVFQPCRWDERDALLMERLDPLNLLTRLGRRPYRIQLVGRLLASLMTTLHQVKSAPGVPSLIDVLAERAHRDPAKSERFGPLLQLARSQAGTSSLLHLDLNPANLLMRPGTRDWVLVDWCGAAVGDPEADVARTLSTIAAGRAPSLWGASAFRWAHPASRGLLARSFFCSYVGRRQVPSDRLTQWYDAWTLIWPTQESIPRLEELCADPFAFRRFSARSHPQAR